MIALRILRAGGMAALLLAVPVPARTASGSPAGGKTPPRVSGRGVTRGVVVDSRGRAVAGAAVRIRTASGRVATLVSGPRGAFEVSLSEGPVVIAVTRAGFAPVCEEAAGRPAGTLTVVLTRGGRVAGRAAEQAAGAFVEVTRPSWSLDPACPPWSVKRAIRGEAFAFEHAPPGRAVVTLLSHDGSLLQQEQVDVREDETASVDFTRRTILVSGRVTRADGPLPGARVMLLGGSGTVIAGDNAESLQRFVGVTGDDGSYQLVVDAPGEYQVRVEGLDGSGYPSRDASIPDAESWLLDLYFPATDLNGIVEDEATGEPVPQARVLVTPRKANAGGGARARSDTDGHFRIALEPGEYALSAQARGYLQEEMGLFLDGSEREAHVTLTPSQTLEGRVVDAGGRAVPGMPVTARNADEAWAAAHGRILTYTGKDGRFHLDVTPGAAYHLLAGPSLAGFAVRARTPAGAPGVVLQLRPAARARVEVRDADGSVVAGALVRVSRLGDLPLSGAGGLFTDTGADGVAELWVPSGSVELEVTASREENARVVLEAAPTEPSAAYVTLGQSRFQRAFE